MKDVPLATSPEAAELFHRLLLARSGEDRVWMACAMLDMARALIIASLPPQVAAVPAERAVAVLCRLYDLDPAFLTRIADDLRRRLSASATRPSPESE